jgi:hypothetical protein
MEVGRAEINLLKERWPDFRVSMEEEGDSGALVQKTSGVIPSQEEMLAFIEEIITAPERGPPTERKHRRV